MASFYARGFPVALTAILSAQIATADISAQDVWSDWKSYLTGAGYEISASENSSGGKLTVTDIKMSMDLPDEAGAMTVSMPEVVFSEAGDGTVSVTFPNQFPMNIQGTDPNGAAFDVQLGYSQSGSSMIVSGTPEEMNYNYTAATIGMALESLSVDGKEIPADAAKGSVTLANVITSTQMKIGDLRSYSQRMSADSLSYDIAFKDPESDDHGSIKGSLTGMGFEGTGKIPLEMDPENMQAMLQKGFGFDGTFKFGAGNTEIQGADGADSFAAQSNSQGGNFKISMDAGHLAYDVNQKDAAVTVTSSQLPFPVAFNFADSGLKLKMPIAKSDEDQDFSFAIKLGDFTMSDMIWGIFDPGNVLPRDPATVALDLTGKAKVLVDFMDPAVAEDLDGMSAPPGELSELNIIELIVSAAGAKLSGNGNFTFDNTDLATFGGVPKPTGKADIQLVGANGLMDKLIQMGLMKEEDAMGARMMMGMLAVPGDGEDTLKSTIEINEEGHVMANGQRLR